MWLTPFALYVASASDCLPDVLLVPAFPIRSHKGLHRHPGPIDGARRAHGPASRKRHRQSRCVLQDQKNCRSTVPKEWEILQRTAAALRAASHPLQTLGPQQLPSCWANLAVPRLSVATLHDHLHQAQLSKAREGHRQRLQGNGCHHLHQLRHCPLRSGAVRPCLAGKS